LVLLEFAENKESFSFLFLREKKVKMVAGIVLE